MSEVPDLATTPDTCEVASQFRSALLAGASPAAIEAQYRQALQQEPMPEGQLTLLVAKVCWELQRKKATRFWLERLTNQATQCSPSELISAIVVAAESGQAEYALHFCEQITPSTSRCPATIVRAAEAMVALAVRMRSPRGSHGVWMTHRKLLDASRALLEKPVHGPCSTEDRARSSSLLARVTRLSRGSSNQA